MARLLIASEDHPTEGLRGLPVDVKPDAHEWGRLEGPPRFWLLDLPDINVERVRWVLENAQDETDHRGVRVNYPRRWRCLWSELTGDLLDKCRRGEPLVVRASGRRDLRPSDLADRLLDRVTETRATTLEREAR